MFVWKLVLPIIQNCFLLYDVYQTVSCSHTNETQGDNKINKQTIKIINMKNNNKNKI